MSGWLFIIFLLLLGGLISTLGDLLGSKIGKARFSVLKLRPKKTAILITILTGSLISASSLFLMILVNRQLRVGLFKLGDLQKKLQESKQVLIPLKKERSILENKIKAKETEFKQLERNIIALRSGKFVIRSGQSLIISEITSSSQEDIKSQIENIIINANKYTHKIVKPESKNIKNLLLLRKNHIEEMQNTILKGGNWVINIKSVRNVLKGENYVYAFPEITENKIIVRKGEKITKIDFKEENFNKKDFGDKVNFLLSSSLAEVKRRGSLTNEIKLRSDSVKELRDFLNKNDKINFELEAVSISNSKTAQPVIIKLNINYPQS
ncbi:conserved hypothetical protein [Prochlorococcus marinus str. MIT 9515]|uniref:Myosin heavy chain n=1 Tax=Prochlorococcus marinus (strain MIT 9515) TaxID=167542 RepID=A2BUM8_PROM5|nr:DUF3084 domain-containing protein [Prochlorococcus marinus]ABM71489.1 conserved hypothetical protein [Prochlorococcus marinus str. MIT 9515]